VAKAAAISAWMAVICHYSMMIKLYSIEVEKMEFEDFEEQVW
jgi:hypothetical protein